jgi:hypothetical protein
MTPPRPRSPQEFIEHASRLARNCKERELLAYAGEFGREFFGRFTADERNRLEGIFESAQAIVDLEDWSAGREQAAGASTQEHPEARVSADPAVPVGGR